MISTTIIGICQIIIDIIENILISLK